MTYNELNFSSFELSLELWPEVCRKMKPDDDWEWWWMSFDEDEPEIYSLEAILSWLHPTKSNKNGCCFNAIPCLSLGEMMERLGEKYNVEYSRCGGKSYIYVNNEKEGKTFKSDTTPNAAGKGLMDVRQAIQEVVGVEPDLPLPYFHAAKVGDEVVDIRQSEITKISDPYHNNSCIRTESGWNWNYNGKFGGKDIQQLFYLSDPNRPKIKVKKKIEIKRWVNIYDNGVYGYTIGALHKSEEEARLGYSIYNCSTSKYITISEVPINFEVEEEV